MPTIKHDPPAFSLDAAAAAARDLFGIEASGAPLPSERDQNVLLTTAGGERFVLKISNAAEDPRVIDLQNQALVRVTTAASGLGLPRVRPTRYGTLMGSLRDATGVAHQVRLLTWVPGQVLADVRPHTRELLVSLGDVLGTIDAALEEFDHDAATRDLKWDPRKAGWIRDYMAQVDDPARRALVERLYTWADAELARLAPALRTSLIYNDANDYNVLVDGHDPYDRRVVAVIDFGDMLRTWTANEPAVAAAYAMLDKPDPMAAAAAVVEGYHARHALTEPEVEALFPLICLRLCVSVVNAAYQRRAEPDNAYLTISERPAWDLLGRLDAIHPRLAHCTLRAACGFEACPATPAITAWLRASQASFGPLLDPDPRRAPRACIDLGVASADAGTPLVWSDIGRFSRHVEDRLRAAGAAVGVGRADEVRGAYGTALFEGQGNDGPEWRTVHLGLDLFAPPGTPVLAPLDGVIHSVADNAGAGDYGPTIVLEHRAGDTPFYTLYGHLSRDTALGWAIGQAVARGATIARLGDASENGGWPPHLHFQIVTDMLGRTADFPGVARPSARRVWLSLVPDPNLIAGIPGGVTAPRPADTDALLAARRAHVGPSLSLSYRRPLSIVRGWMQHLYDADGRVYLDAVNNVPHVGHSHPRVVEAGQRQMALLNTNTRYLHERLGRYAERLCATLPDPLRVCFFVNSGSEATELALRIARASTGSRQTIVVDVGYHGNTSAAVEISPYKFNGPGGAGAPPHVHVVPTPDVFRGRYRAPDPQAGRKYASHVAEAVELVASRGDRVGAFIAESILSCAGQIVLPQGYLAPAYQAVRQAGGVCIADEVQTGFGRSGTHFWAFESQAVVPDIVTMGKPIGNGHPLGAVVTTAAIAAAFANGMEYFNTYGGNPVSCAIGEAVLDVIAEERLQANALRVGAALLGRLRALQPRHRLIGDVRGLGLFVGIELVRDRATLEPAGTEAGLLANRLRDRGVLVSTDGPYHNVLKIKPPMCVTQADAERLASEIDELLSEDYFR
jgi:4-aminobutyrate aminotransferase-like enzyme/Ser/Thr protein kinase RdoA (MazF antagonist)/murein DD-endopeptidase MepM/ murein hydrolase activator NlpD